MTNSEVARAAAAARKKVEEQAPSEPIRERKFLGDGDGAASRRMGPPADDDETVSIAGHVSSASGPPQPRFGCHADETSWLGEHSFETYGFADALPTNSWLRVSPPAAVRVFSLSSRWI
jgi:hypothetical protein